MECEWALDMSGRKNRKKPQGSRTPPALHVNEERRYSVLQVAAQFCAEEKEVI